MKMIISIILVFSIISIDLYAQSIDVDIEQDRYANINGLNMYYEVHGKGEPLLFLHGGGLCTDAHREEINFLAQYFRVIAADRQGHGKTADIDREISYNTMATDELKLLQYLGIDSCYVYGNSDGGTVALHISIQSPKTIKKLIVEGANYHYSGIEDSWTKLLESATPEMYQNDFFNNLSPNGPGYWPKMLTKLKNMWLNSPVLTTFDLNKIICPTLIIVGDKDMIEIEHTVSLFKAIKNGNLLIVPATSHGAMAEKPDFVKPILIEFINIKKK